MDAISHAEGTGDDVVRAGRKFDSGYDVTFGNNLYGVPEKPVSQMTLDEVARYQGQVFHNHGGRLGMTSDQAEALISGFPRGR